MQHQAQTPPATWTAAPQRKRRVWPWLSALAAVLAACGFGTVALVGAAGSPADDVTAPAAGRFTTNPQLTPDPDPSVGGVPVPVTTVLTVKDVKLTAKITDRQCFGSAGCNVQYTIKAAVAKPVSESYDVTYTVHGFDDGDQIGTLTLGADGTLEQDAFNAGSVKSAGTKLTVKITDLERS